MIVAGLGFSSGCTADDIVRMVHMAQARAGCVVGSLAAPGWKQGTPVLHIAARHLGLPITFVDADALSAVRSRCPTRSVIAGRKTGVDSVAEGAALAAFGGRLLMARIAHGSVTCALAGP